MPNPRIEDTIELIKDAHKNQTRSGGEPYWKHPYEVMNLVPLPTEDELHAALLHDVLEDTDYTEEDLRNYGYNENVINMVKWVTNPGPGGSFDYYGKIENLVNNGPVGAIKIKWADTTHNTSDLDKMGEWNPKGAQKKRNKYTPTLQLLTDTLSIKGYDVYNNLG